MRLIDLDAIMAQFPKADFYGDAIENMKAYPYWKTDITGLINILEAVPIIEQSEDCISREKVFEQISCWVNSGEYRYTNATYYLTRRIQGISSVTPQQKTGKWIVHPKGIYAHLVCNKCLSYAPYDCKTNYCPDCGACMVEREGEE